MWAGFRDLLGFYFFLQDVMWNVPLFACILVHFVRGSQVFYFGKNLFLFCDDAMISGLQDLGRCAGSRFREMSA